MLSLSCEQAGWRRGFREFQGSLRHPSTVHPLLGPERASWPHTGSHEAAAGRWRHGGQSGRLHAPCLLLPISWDSLQGFRFQAVFTLKTEVQSFPLCHNVSSRETPLGHTDIMPRGAQGRDMGAGPAAVDRQAHILQATLLRLLVWEPMSSGSESMKGPRPLNIHLFCFHAFPGAHLLGDNTCAAPFPLTCFWWWNLPLQAKFSLTCTPSSSSPGGSEGRGAPTLPCRKACQPGGHQGGAGFPRGLGPEDPAQLCPKSSPLENPEAGSVCLFKS